MIDILTVSKILALARCDEQSVVANPGLVIQTAVFFHVLVLLVCLRLPHFYAKTGPGASAHFRVVDESCASASCANLLHAEIVV